MPATDAIHEPVKNALIKDGWTITDDPYPIKYGNLRLSADLGAERTLAAQRGVDKIVVEIKSFIGASFIHDFEQAVGQYAIYRDLLAATEPERFSTWQSASASTSGSSSNRRSSWFWRARRSG